MSTLSYDIRQGRRWAILAGGASLGAFVILCVVLAVIWLVRYNDQRGDASALDTRVSTSTYSSTAIEAFGCVADADLCSGYDNAKAYLLTLAPGTFTYSSLPRGSATVGDAVEVALSSLDDLELQAVGRAVTLDGRLMPEDVAAERFAEVDDTTATFAVPGNPELIGTASFVISEGSETVYLSSLVYSQGG